MYFLLNCGSFPGSQNLQEVLETVIHGAVELPDPIGQKTCFGVLKKLVEVWGKNHLQIISY